MVVSQGTTEKTMKKLKNWFFPVSMVLILGLRQFWGMNSSKDEQFLSLLILVLIVGLMMFLNYKRVINIDKWPVERFLIVFALVFAILTAIIYLIDLAI